MPLNKSRPARPPLRLTFMGLHESSTHCDQSATHTSSSGTMGRLASLVHARSGFFGPLYRSFRRTDFNSIGLIFDSKQHSLCAAWQEKTGKNKPL